VVFHGCFERPGIEAEDVTGTDDIVSALKDKKGGVLIEGIYPNGVRAYYGFGL